MEQKDRKQILEAFGKLIDIMEELREKCPWDRQQNFNTLRTLTIEETYELADAIINEDYKGIEEELGDLLLHIVFYAKLGDEMKKFDILSVLENICNKLIYRHPHVYGNVDVNNNPEKVKKNWEDLKKKEGKNSILEGVPNTLPAMIKAIRIQDKARSAGFDWEKPFDVWDKVTEEINELKQAAENLNNKEEIEEEFGDFLFSIINAARLYNIDPEIALEKTNKKFIKRFKFIEERSRQLGKPINKMTLEEMNNIWEEAKKIDN